MAHQGRPGSRSQQGSLIQVTGLEEITGSPHSWDGGRALCCASHTFPQGSGTKHTESVLETPSDWRLETGDTIRLSKDKIKRANSSVSIPERQREHSAPVQGRENLLSKTVAERGAGGFKQKT